MASTAGNGRTRCRSNRLPATSASRHEAGEQIHGLPAPVRIRWYRTSALAPEGRGPRPDPERALRAVQAATRQALAGLDGPWSARIAPLEAFCIEIASPSRLTHWQKAWVIVTEGLS